MLSGALPDSIFISQQKLFALLALLVGNTAGGLACGLAGGLALAAATGLERFLKVAGA